MTAERWSDEHSARTAPIGIVLYDDDDDLFTIKTGSNEWTVYYGTRQDGVLNDRDIDRDRGDQILGRLETVRGVPVGRDEQ